MARPGWLKRSVQSAMAAVASFVGWSGAYHSTDLRRKALEAWRLQKATANQALGVNLQTIVDQARHLERTSPIARGVIEGIKADIVGTGMDVEPDTGSEGLNKRIREKWLAWAECAGHDGTPLWELQLMGAAEWATAGCILHRYIVLPERLADGHLPLAILPLEPEWLAPIPVGPVAAGNSFVAGKEIDRLGRVVAYHLQDPNSNMLGSGVGGERVSPSEICHGYERRRAFQAQGEPALAAVIERVKQAEDLIAIELAAAKATAAPAVAIMSEVDPGSETDDGEAVTDIPAGATVRLLPGEKIETVENNRPSQKIHDFVGAMLGGIAAATRVARKWLTRDYSGATYMNTRMEQLDSVRQHRPIQQWLGRHVASYPYERVLPWILLSLGVAIPADPAARRQLFRHKLMFDLPPYVDPQVDGEAAAHNMSANLSTLEDECAAKGKDWRKVLQQRAKERAEMERLGLTPPATAQEPKGAEEPEPEADDEEDETADEKPQAKSDD